MGRCVAQTEKPCFKSYLTTYEGIDQFYNGLAEIREGRSFISCDVQEKIDLRSDTDLKPATELSQIKIEVVRCICNGFQKNEIADNLHLSPRTVETYRQDIYRCLSVRNGEELFKAALDLEIVTKDELVFRHNNFSLKPYPKINEKPKVRNEKRQIRYSQVRKHIADNIDTRRINYGYKD